ncbi:FAD-dependent oxidoreductase [Salicola sp. Rm-C-2C1-2]|uniref:FAD-dependent oxidoreductase n=1 Tax=Salicola sp. Rm-C-2C1-2 TaxID=3141321 RepID=UPI0032E509C1
MSEREHDIAVIGAGMVGAALALACAASGWRVVVIEPSAPEEPTPESDPDLRVSALSAGSEALLRQLGVWPAMEAMRMAPFGRLAVWEAPTGPLASVPGGRLVANQARTEFNAEALGRSHLGHIVENRVTRWALWQRMGDHDRITRLYPATLKTLEHTNDGVTLTLDTGNTVPVTLVVGADGANSATRRMAGIGTSRNQYRQQAMVINIRHAPPAETITWQMFTPQGPKAYLPLPEANGSGWGSLVWYDQPETLDELTAMDESQLLAAIRRNFPLTLPDPEAAPARGRFPIAREHAHQYARGRVVLVGDAAHTINPLAGQGVNLGFRDAAALARCLGTASSRNDPGDARILTAYETERRPHNRLMMDAMDLFYHLFSNANPPLHLARTLGLGLAGRIPFAHERVTRYAMGIDEHLPAPIESLIKRLA